MQLICKPCIDSLLGETRGRRADDERRRPDIVLNASRKKRIAVGSGTTVEEINKLLKQFEQIRKLMKQFTDMGGKPGRKGRPGRAPLRIFSGYLWPLS